MAESEPQFGIHIDDGSEVLSSFAVDENNKRAEMYSWQRRAISYFFRCNKVIFESSTGAGKTFLTVEILKRILDDFPKYNVLVVAPKNVIMEDTWYKELYNNGINLPDIGVYYGKIKELSKITLTNVQSISTLDLNDFDVIVLDECHNTTQRLLNIIAKKDWKFMVGLTATFERRDNKHWALLKMFDYNLFQYTPRQALDEGVLNPFNFMSIGVEMDENTKDEYNSLTNQLNVIFQAYGGFGKIIRSKKGIKNKMLYLFSKRKQLLANYHRKFDVVQQICKKFLGEKTIIFNQYNSQTSALYWYLLESGVKACIVHSSMDGKKRENNMIDFRKGKYNVMLASKVLDEGYNLPQISVGVIMAGDSVRRQTIQRMGRVLRRKKDPSELFQLYCKDTIEEDNARVNNKFFKELATNYREYTYLLDKTVDL